MALAIGDFYNLRNLNVCCVVCEVLRCRVDFKMQDKEEGGFEQVKYRFHEAGSHRAQSAGRDSFQGLYRETEQSIARFNPVVLSFPLIERSEVV